jgi:hypothetical protein
MTCFHNQNKHCCNFFSSEQRGLKKYYYLAVPHVSKSKYPVDTFILRATDKRKINSITPVGRGVVRSLLENQGLLKSGFWLNYDF